LHNQYVTIFDSNFLPQGIALNISLQRFAGQYTLWVICADDLAFKILKKLNLANIRLLNLVDLETDELRFAKKNRNFREYFWTLTPFLAKFIFNIDPSIEQIIYIDADMWLISDPSSITEEFIKSGKDILITKHAYAKEYDQSKSNGEFCVQFLIFKNNQKAELVRKEWELECLEWCYQEPSAGKFGDQKYLDKWPTSHGDVVHILGDLAAMQGPWNTIKFPYQRAIFHHFHGFRLGKDYSYSLSSAYEIPAQTIQNIYEPYFLDIVLAIRLLRQHGIQYKDQLKSIKTSLFRKLIKNNLVDTKKLPKRPIHVLNISIGDRKGGASRSAFALHQAINESSDNVISTLLVKTKDTSDPFVVNTMSVVQRLRYYFLNTLENLFRGLFKGGSYHSFGISNAGINRLINNLNPDVIHLHWICGLLSVRDIGKIQKPIVWTLHDAWPMLGISHLIESSNLNAYTGKLQLLDNFIYALKKWCWKNKKFRFIAPSLWIKKATVGSRLALNNSVDVISNAIDFDRCWFKVRTDKARSALNLPILERVILYSALNGAIDQNKGLSLFIDSINNLTDKYHINDALNILLIGNNMRQFTKHFNPNVSLFYLEDIKEDKILRDAYSAANVCVVPSKIENLSNTILESLACDTPVVAFDVGGNSELITHKKNGWLAKPYDIEDLADGIYWAMNEFPVDQDNKLNHKIFFEKYKLQIIASEHLAIYKKVLST